MDMSERNPDSGNLIFAAPASVKFYNKAIRYAREDVPILLTGESGTGKTELAKAIHKYSGRAGNFCITNISALPETLVESELFGYKRGAFTGAQKDKVGKFHLADKGTLLIDEIGDLAPGIQLKILGALENGYVEPLGGSGKESVDVRIITATNQDIRRALESGMFRHDLYYRISTLSLHLPPLMERIEDIPALAEYFLEKENRKRPDKKGKELGKGSTGILCQYTWPGNVRQLRDFISKAVILSDDDVLSRDFFEHLLNEELTGKFKPASQENSLRLPYVGHIDYRAAVDETKRRIIRGVLQNSEGNYNMACETLKIDMNTLQEEMSSLGLAGSAPELIERPAASKKSEIISPETTEATGNVAPVEIRKILTADYIEKNFGIYGKTLERLYSHTRISRGLYDTKEFLEQFLHNIPKDGRWKKRYDPMRAVMSLGFENKEGVAEFLGEEDPFEISRPLCPHRKYMPSELMETTVMKQLGAREQDIDDFATDVLGIEPMEWGTCRGGGCTTRMIYIPGNVILDNLKEFIVFLDK